MVVYSPVEACHPRDPAIDTPPVAESYPQIYARCNNAAGAKAVVGVRMETNSVYDGMLDVVMLGTAVYFTR